MPKNQTLPKPSRAEQGRGEGLSSSVPFSAGCCSECGSRELAFQAECAGPSVPVPGSVTLYRLVLSHPDWPCETHTKWQELPDFTKALAKAKEHGVTARVESQNV